MMSDLQAKYEVPSNAKAGRRAIEVLLEWASVVPVGVTAIIRILRGRDQSCEPVGSPPEIGEVSLDDDAIQETENAR